MRQEMDIPGGCSSWNQRGNQWEVQADLLNGHRESNCITPTWSGTAMLGNLMMASGPGLNGEPGDIAVCKGPAATTPDPMWWR